MRGIGSIAQFHQFTIKSVHGQHIAQMHFVFAARVDQRDPGQSAAQLCTQGNGLRASSRQPAQHHIARQGQFAQPVFQIFKPAGKTLHQRIPRLVRKTGSCQKALRRRGRIEQVFFIKNENGCVFPFVENRICLLLGISALQHGQNYQPTKGRKDGDDAQTCRK